MKVQKGVVREAFNSLVNFPFFGQTPKNFRLFFFKASLSSIIFKSSLFLLDNISIYMYRPRRVPKCRGHGGQRPRKFIDGLRKILSKMCKKGEFWYVCTKFELLMKNKSLNVHLCLLTAINSRFFGFYCEIGLSEFCAKFSSTNLPAQKIWHLGTLGHCTSHYNYMLHLSTHL